VGKKVKDGQIKSDLAQPREPDLGKLESKHMEMCLT